MIWEATLNWVCGTYRQWVVEAKTAYSEVDICPICLEIIALFSLITCLLLAHVSCDVMQRNRLHDLCPFVTLYKALKALWAIHLYARGPAGVSYHISPEVCRL